MGGMAGCGFEDALHIVQAAVGRSACLGTVESMVTGAFPHILLVFGFCSCSTRAFWSWAPCTVVLVLVASGVTTVAATAS